jgi:glycosyltransferase involved in cell wall biosynthesis
MKVLVAHNFYQQPGGEDVVFRSELALLEQFGHKPVPFEMHNDSVKGMGRLRLLGATIWNRGAARELRDLVRREKVDLVHFHNTFPLMSPSVYYAARDEGAAVVQTLHNFRLLCPGANFYRDGEVCEKCLGKSLPLAGIKHKCYRDSTAASAATAGMLALHRGIGTYANVVDAFITPTHFARRKFIAGGLPAEKIVVKPNFLDPDPGPGGGGGGYAIFVGRLSHEKGLDTLLAAWELCRDAVPLKIVGDGPLADQVKSAAERNRGIEWLGRREGDELMDLIGRAEVLVFPSNCYETFGRVAAEAFARGTPVIASGHGAPADIVDDGRTGFLFKPGDAADLAAKVWAVLPDRAQLARMREEVRREYLRKYTGARNYEMLMLIYQKARVGHACHDVPDVPEHVPAAPAVPVAGAGAAEAVAPAAAAAATAAAATALAPPAIAEPITPWETPA